MNVKIYVASLLCLTALIAVNTAYASGFERHGYLLASVGKADTRMSPTSNDQIDGDDTAFEIGVGFAINPYLAVEGSYQNFGEPNGYAGCPVDVLCIAIVPFAREDVKVDGWSAALRGSVPLTETLSAFGRIGFLAWDASARTPSLDDSSTDLLYGVGISADFDTKFGLQLSYEKVEADIETVKVGVRMRF